MDKNTAIDKIKTLRQAQKLMALYKVDALDVSLADVTEETVLDRGMGTKKQERLA